MIKTSALLVVLAIGLLVAGVLASSLPMVYISIGVCAVAALLLAVNAGSIKYAQEARPYALESLFATLDADVARAALFLASDDSDFITGVGITVDGGLTWRTI